MPRRWKKEQKGKERGWEGKKEKERREREKIPNITMGYVKDKGTVTVWAPPEVNGPITKVGLDVETVYAIHTAHKTWGYENFYYLHNWSLWGMQHVPYHAGMKCLQRVQEGDWLGIFVVVRVWKQNESSYVVWITYQWQRRKHLGFDISFLRCRALREVGSKD